MEPQLLCLRLFNFPRGGKQWDLPHALASVEKALRDIAAAQAFPHMPIGKALQAFGYVALILTGPAFEKVLPFDTGSQYRIAPNGRSVLQTRSRVVENVQAAAEWLQHALSYIQWRMKLDEAQAAFGRPPVRDNLNFFKVEDAVAWLGGQQGEAYFYAWRAAKHADDVAKARAVVTESVPA